MVQWLHATGTVAANGDFGLRGYSNPKAPAGGMSMPVWLVSRNLGKNRGSTKNWMPKLSFDLS